MHHGDAPLLSVARCPGIRQGKYIHRLAPQRIPAILALEVQADRSAAAAEAAEGIDPRDGHRESCLSARDLRRVQSVRNGRVEITADTNGVATLRHDLDWIECWLLGNPTNTRASWSALLSSWCSSAFFKSSSCRARSSHRLAKSAMISRFSCVAIFSPL